MSLFGYVENVATVNLGEELVADVTAGDLTLAVVDVSTFSDNGGLLLLNGVLLEYAGIIEDTDTVTLVDPAPAALAGDRAELYPASPDKIAFVNLGDDGDSITVVVPHNYVPLLPDGFRSPGTEEAALVDERSPGEWILVDLPATTAEVGGLHIAAGDVPADRLNVGVTTNLIQDPTFLSGLWDVDVNAWLIDVETSGTYDGSGFLRSINDGTQPAIPDLAGTVDSTYQLVDTTAADPGRQIRVAALIRCDAAAVTATNIYARLRVQFDNSDGTTTSAAPQIAFLTIGDAQDVPVGVWTQLEGYIDVPDGAVAFRLYAQTTRQVAGAIDFMLPECQMIWDQVQSSDYTPGTAGYSLTPTSAQLTQLAVLSDLSATHASFDSSFVAGVDVGQRLADMPQGVLVYARSWGVSTAQIADTETILYELVGPTVKLGRVYRVQIHGHMQGTVANDAFDLQLRYTIDGTVPTMSSGVLDGSLTRVNLGGGNAVSTAFTVLTFYSPADTRDMTRFVLTMKRAIGTGTAQVYGNDANRVLMFMVEDMGAASVINASGGGGILAQRSKATGTPDPSPAVGTAKTFQATWVRSFNADGTTMSGDPQEAYQGQPSAAIGNRRSLVGFDYVAIQAALTTGTVTSCKLVFRVQESTPATGMTVVIGTHSYSAVPATWVATNVTSNRIRSTLAKAGQTYTVELGTTVGAELKAGFTRGIAFGPGPSTSTTYAGGIYGPATASAPKLVITYTNQAS